MNQPIDVTHALLIDALAQRYGRLPTEILEADMENLRIAEIAVLMRAPDGE